jgi:hypothetical protein
MAATEVAFRRHRQARGLPVEEPGSDPEAALTAAVAAVGGAQGASLSAARADLERRATWRAPGAPVAGPATGHWPAGSPAPAAWYADPWRQARWRWWDGTRWTGHVAN